MHNLLTKNSTTLVLLLLASALLVIYFGIPMGLYIALFFTFFVLLSIQIVKIYRELFGLNKEKIKLIDMVSKNMLFDNNIWMHSEYDSLFDNLKYACKQAGAKVILFKIQLEEIANIRNKAKDEESDEYKMAELAIKRIEDFQKSNILRLEDKDTNAASSEMTKEHSNIEELYNNNNVVVIEKGSAAPAKPSLPGDPKEGVHKSLLINSLITKLNSEASYTFVSLNPELRVRLRAYLNEHEDKKAEIVEVGSLVKLAENVEKWRSGILEKIQTNNTYKKTKTTLKKSKEIYKTLKKQRDE